MIKVDYDRDADAAYIYFSQFPDESVEKTYLCDPSQVNGMINLDFNKTGQLVGIEIIDASQKLPKSVLDEFTEI